MMKRSKIKLVLATIILLMIPAFTILAFIENRQQEEVVKEMEQQQMRKVGDYQPDSKTIEKQVPELPSEAAKEEAQAAAVNFVQAFNSFDAADPEGYRQAAAPYMTKQLKETYSQIQKRNTLESQKVIVTGTDVLPVQLEKNFQIWNVVATNEETAIDGSTQVTATQYSLALTIEDGRWLVGSLQIVGYE